MPHNKYFYGLYLESRDSVETDWEDANLEPIDFFLNIKEARVIKSAINRTSLQRPVIQKELLNQ